MTSDHAMNLLALEELSRIIYLVRRLQQYKAEEQWAKAARIKRTLTDRKDGAYAFCENWSESDDGSIFFDHYTSMVKATVCQQP